MRIWSPANTGSIICAGEALEQSVTAFTNLSSPTATMQVALRKMLRLDAGTD